ncbi:MAG: CBS domain-containing protein [Limnoraphis robusta]|jgi:tRNA nucleotidyltransferase (CCA-adding enzyme)
MHLILCHTTADFDALGAAVGLSRLYPGSKIVLTGGSHPAVRDFLALHRDEFPLLERRSVNPENLRFLTVVDTQTRERLGKASEWFDLPNLYEITVCDHHPDSELNIPATTTQIESVGATTTLVVEQLQLAEKQSKTEDTKWLLTAAEATVMALGIHVDTGSLTFEGSTPRDALALAWLMQKGASLQVIAEYIEPGFSPQLQNLLTTALEQLNQVTVHGYKVAWILLETEDYVPGLSSLASQLIEITESDALLLGNCQQRQNKEAERLTIIGRSRIEQTNLNQLFKPLGGGGHHQAASVVIKDTNPSEKLAEIVEAFQAQIPHPPTAKELMSSPVRTIRPETTIAEAHRILLRYGHSGLSVVDEQDQLVGIISRRDLDIALHHGFSHAPVKGYMTPQLKTITPDTTLPEIESLMVTYDIGRLPVLEGNNLVGIVTRTDVLRLLHQQQQPKKTLMQGCIPGSTCHSIQELLEERLAPPLLKLLNRLAELTQERGWQLYLVGGAVRDLLLADSEKTLLLTDIDLVVDGCHHSLEVTENPQQKAKNPPAVELASALQKSYSNARLDVHGQFQTAALLWHNDPILDSLWIDIATARTEFYPYPAANPEVEASSIRQDLYRRDFTINALALRLTQPHQGELLDFFGGVNDLENRKIRVLHANSFIEDPTRIYRAVRFAVRLGFDIEFQTKDYIQYAINSGIYERVQSQNYSAQQRVPALETRLKSELKYILQAPYWKPALQLLGELKALRCIHPTLELNPELWRQIQFVDRCLLRFDPEKTLTHWQVRLEVLIAHLAPEYRGDVAETLQFPVDSTERLQQLESAKAEVVKLMPECQLPSQFYRLLVPYNLPMLILIAVQCPRWVRRRIWQYLTHWWNIKPLLNGNDLKQLGYKPSRQFKQMLDDLLVATLDKEICDRKSAEAFIQAKYSLLGDC